MRGRCLQIKAIFLAGFSPFSFWTCCSALQSRLALNCAFVDVLLTARVNKKMMIFKGSQEIML